MWPFRAEFDNSKSRRSMLTRVGREKKPNLRRIGNRLECLERRELLSGSPVEGLPVTITQEVRPLILPLTPHGSLDWSSGPVGLLPAQIRHAYGVDQIRLPTGTTPDGTGQTIAIVDPFDDSSIGNDLDDFDNHVSINGGSETLYQQYGSHSSFFTQVAPFGTPNGDPNHAMEISLDVEWAHAIAPGAKIMLVEAPANQDNSLNLLDLAQAAYWAAGQPAVSTVSMSWGFTEFSGETTFDSYFKTPPGHPGVTFVAASGDSGAPAAYPAYSPNVLGVGGTTLSINGSNQWVGETGWSGSGGGVSSQEKQPSYQKGVVPPSTTMRAAPDVSFDGDPNSGVTIADTYGFTGPDPTPWEQVGGTSLGAPVWAALVAIADQGRVAEGLSVLDGPTQTLPLVYGLPAGDLHDITSGNNGNQAGSGYDFVTGRGTPIANQLVPALVPKLSPSAQQTANGAQVAATGDLNTQSLFLVDQNGLVDQDVYSYSSQSHGRFPIDSMTLFKQGSELTEYSDGPTVSVFGVGLDSRVHWIQWSSASGWTDSVLDANTAFAPGTAIGLYAVPGELDLFATGSDGYVKHDQYVGSTGHWSGFSTVGPGIVFNPGTPLAIAPLSQIDLFGVLPNGDVGQVQWNGSAWLAIDLQGLGAGFTASATNPGSPLTVIAPGGQINIFGVNSTGNAAQVQYNGAWVGFPVTSQPGLLAAGAPLNAAMFGSTIELFGVDINGSLVQVYYDGIWHWGGVGSVGSGFVPTSQVTVNTVGGVLEVFGELSTGHLADVAYAYPAWSKYDLG